MSKKVHSMKGISQNRESKEITEDPTLHSAHPTGVPNAFQNRGWDKGF